MSESKEATIKRIYENPASGYGSVRDTYVQANRINPGTRYVEVKEHLDKLYKHSLNAVGITHLCRLTLCLKLRLI